MHVSVVTCKRVFVCVSSCVYVFVCVCEWVGVWGGGLGVVDGGGLPIFSN